MILWGRILLGRSSHTNLAIAGGAVQLDSEHTDIDAESELLPLRATAEKNGENKTPLVRRPGGTA